MVSLVSLLKYRLFHTMNAPTGELAPPTVDEPAPKAGQTPVQIWPN